MKKEEIITAIIMILVIVLEIFIQIYNKKSISELTGSLNDLKKITIENLDNDEKIDEMQEKSQQIFEHWLKKFNVMAYFIEHDELEKVNTQMRKIKAEYEAGSIEDAVPEIEEGIFILEHIEDRQKITWKNIF